MSPLGCPSDETPWDNSPVAHLEMELIRCKPVPSLPTGSTGRLESLHHSSGRCLYTQVMESLRWLPHLPAIPVSCTSFSAHSLLHTSSTQKHPCNGNGSQFPAARLSDSWKWQSKVRSCCHPLNSACECPLCASSPWCCSVCWAQMCSLSKAMSHLCLEPSSSEDDRSSSGSWFLEDKAFLVNIFSCRESSEEAPSPHLVVPLKTTC